MLNHPRYRRQADKALHLSERIIHRLAYGHWLLSPNQELERITSIREVVVSQIGKRQRMGFLINDRPLEEWSEIPLTLDFLEAQGFRMEETTQHITYHLPGLDGSVEEGNSVRLRCFKKAPERFRVELGVIYFMQDFLKLIDYRSLATVAELQYVYMQYVFQPLNLNL